MLFMLKAEKESIICGTGQDPAKTICNVAAERFVFIAHKEFCSELEL